MEGKVWCRKKSNIVFRKTEIKVRTWDTMGGGNRKHQLDDRNKIGMLCQGKIEHRTQR
jgi:hypothetical protein